MLVNEKSILAFNDLLDQAFDKGEKAAKLLRQAGRSDLASTLEKEFIARHDEAMKQHGLLITAARADDVEAFRKHGMELTQRMRAFQTCMAEAAVNFDIVRKKPR